jgi:hypothetical protein
MLDFGEYTYPCETKTDGYQITILAVETFEHFQKERTTWTQRDAAEVSPQ